MNNKLRQKGWNDMSQRLDANLPRDRKRVFAIWWVWGIVALIGMGAWFMYNQQDEAQAPATSSDIVQSAIQREYQPDQASKSEKGLGSSVSTDDSPSILLGQRVSSNSTPSRAGSPDLLADTGISESSKSDGLDSREIKEDVQASLQAMTSPESQQLVDQETGASERKDAQLSPLPDFPLSSPFILSLPEISGLVSLQPSSTIQSSPIKVKTESGYFVDLAAGTRVAQPYSYVGQAGMGWRAPLSDKWSYSLSWGAGVEGMHQPARVALKEFRQSSRSLQEDISSGSTGSVTNGFPGSGEFGAAEIQLRNHYFAYFGLHTAYQFAPNWAFRFGVETAYRFYISSEESYGLNFSSDGSFSIDNSSRNIAQDFVLFNRWDFRPVAGLNYKLRSNMSLNLTYRHGTNPLLPNPIQDTPAGHARFVQLGVQFDL